MKPKQITSREDWLSAAVEQLRPRFIEAKHPIPKKVRVSCGLPHVGGFRTKKRVLGEVWSSNNSRDEHHEIFISPTQDEPAHVLAVLTHELVHTAVGMKCGHRGAFVDCARSVGLMGPWTSTTANDALAAELKRIARELGKYPHGSLEGMTTNKKKQTTRLIKVGCPECGYATRITMQWILTGIPKCPNRNCPIFGHVFEVCLPDAGELAIPGDDDEGVEGALDRGEPI